MRFALEGRQNWPEKALCDHLSNPNDGVWIYYRWEAPDGDPFVIHESVCDMCLPEIRKKIKLLSEVDAFALEMQIMNAQAAQILN